MFSYPSLVKQTHIRSYESMLEQIQALQPTEDLDPVVTTKAGQRRRLTQTVSNLEIGHEIEHS